jgi:hypothetical protein
MAAAILSCIFAAIKAWPDMKASQYFSLGAFIFYILVGLVITSIVVLISAMRSSRRAPGPEETQNPRDVVHTVAFEYLPKSPLENDWTQSYNPDGVADYGSDPEIPGSLRMKIVKSEVAIHYNLPPHATLADHLEYTAKYSNTTMIFARLFVSTRDDTFQRLVDIKVCYGHRRALPTTPSVPNDPKRQLPEQTVYLPAQVLSGERLAFNIDLKDAVALSLGSQGWIFRSIQGVRLRGNLSISPLVFGKSRAISDPQK